MTDDLDPPRPASSRWRLAAMVAVAGAVLAVGVPVVLVNWPSAAVPPIAGTVAAPDVQPPAVPSLPPTRTPASTGPTPAQLLAPKGMPDEDGCPVSAARLMTALLSSDVYDRVAPTEDLSDLECYGTYALGRTAPVNADPVVVVFRYSETTDSWQALSAGTSGYCDRVVPAAVRVHLERCH